ncbi:hypothetical protein GCM10027296_43340 [Chitinimonas naiadis]
MVSSWQSEWWVFLSGLLRVTDVSALAGIYQVGALRIRQICRSEIRFRIDKLMTGYDRDEAEIPPHHLQGTDL